MARKVSDRQDFLSYKTPHNFIDFDIDGDAVCIEMQHGGRMAFTAKQALHIGIKLQDYAYQLGESND